MKSLETRVRKLEERTPQLNGEPVRFIHLVPFSDGEDLVTGYGKSWEACVGDRCVTSMAGESFEEFTARIEAADTSKSIYFVTTIEE